MSGSLRSLFAILRALVTNNFITQSRHVLLPVLLSIYYTQWLWVGVYNCQMSDTFSLDEREDVNNFDNDIDVYLLPGAIAVILLAVFFPIKTIYKAFESIFFLSHPIVMAGIISRHGTTLLPGMKTGAQLAIANALTAAYGGGFLMATLTQLLSPRWLQFFLITNDALMATIILRFCPETITWYILAAGATIESVQFLMGPVFPGIYSTAHPWYTVVVADGPPPPADDDGEDSSESEESDDDFVASRSSDRFSEGADQPNSWDDGNGSAVDSDGSSSDEEEELPRVVTVRFLNGPCLFFAIIVGRSMAAGGPLPALATTCGLLVGFAYTAMVKTDLLPALPISFLFGFFCHIFTCSVVREIAKNPAD